jgi:hypothetical protein
MTERVSCPSCGISIDTAAHDARVARQAVEAAVTIERTEGALQVGWPGSRGARQAYSHALAAALRVALLAPSQRDPSDLSGPPNAGGR